MGMENGYGNDIKPLEKPLKTKHNDIDNDELLEGTLSASSSSSSSPLASSSASSSSSSSFEDESLNPEPRSSSPCPNISLKTPQWSMISGSPSNSTRLSSSPEPYPPSNSTSEYDPNRIPMSIFGSKSTAITEWSVASNESLFSIQMGNNSFSRDHALFMNKSGELTENGTPSFNARRSTTHGKSFSSTLPPVIEGAVDNEERGEHTSQAIRVQESNGENPKSAVAEQSAEQTSRMVVSSDDHSFAMLGANTTDSRGIPCTPNPPRLSDGSGTSSSSFAFPVLVNEGSNGKSSKSGQEKPESEQKAQGESESQAEAAESSKEEAAGATEGSWFSYLFCLRRCC